MIRFRVWPVLLFAAGLFLMIGGTSAQPAGQPGQPKVVPFPGQPKVVPLPVQPFPGQPGQPIARGELPFVPKSAAAFLSVKVSDLVEHPDLKPVLEQLKKTPEALDHLTELVGVLPHEIERVTLFWPTIGSHGPGEPVLVVTTREAFNEARVLKSLKAEPVFDGGRGNGLGGGAAKPVGPKSGSGSKSAPIEIKPSSPDLSKPKEAPPKPGNNDEPQDACTATAEVGSGDPLFYELPRGPFGLLFLVDDRTMVFLPTGFDSEMTQLALLAQLIQKKPSGPLADAISAGAGHTLAAGVYLPPIFREFDRRMPPELAPYAALLAARTGVITGDLGKTAKLTLTLAFDDAAAAKRAGPVLEEGLKALAEKAAGLAVEMKNAKSGRDLVFAPLMETAATGLKNAAVKTNGNAVVATTEVDVGPAAGKAVAELLQLLAWQKKFIGRTNNLKQIGLALHNYHDVNGKLPTNVYNAKGEAILSWRVHLLPYLEQNNLYLKFKLDEPWDSENNKPLVEMMPKTFEVPGRDNPKGKTFFQAFVSPNPAKPQPKGVFGQAWFVEGEKQGRTLVGIPDGTSNTIAIVEARDAVIWSKPDDLPFGEKLPPLGAEGADRFAALFFDGHTAMIPTKIDATTLRALITVNGGEVVSDEWDDSRPGRNSRPGGGGGGDGAVPPRPGDPSSPPAANPVKKPTAPPPPEKK